MIVKKSAIDDLAGLFVGLDLSHWFEIIGDLEVASGDLSDALNGLALGYFGHGETAAVFAHLEDALVGDDRVDDSVAG